MAFASKSPWVIHYDGSSCNGCDIEVLATLCPGFDGERFGVVDVYKRQARRSPCRGRAGR